MNKNRVVSYTKSDDWGVLFCVQRGTTKRLYSFELDNISMSSRGRILCMVVAYREKSKHNHYQRKDVERFSFDEAIDFAGNINQRMMLKKATTGG